MGRDRLVVGAGALSPIFSPDGQTVGTLGLTYRFGQKLLVLGPSLGALVTTDRGTYLGAGIYASLNIGPIVLTPEFQVGHFEPSDGVDLGSSLQFQSLIEISLATESGARVGVRLSHVSNGDTADSNPGTETVLAVMSFPLCGPPWAHC